MQKELAFIDVISPRVVSITAGKSHDYVRGHNDAANRLDFMPQRAPIRAGYRPCEVIEPI